MMVQIAATLIVGWFVWGFGRMLVEWVKSFDTATRHAAWCRRQLKLAQRDVERARANGGDVDYWQKSVEYWQKEIPYWDRLASYER